MLRIRAAGALSEHTNAVAFLISRQRGVDFLSPDVDATGHAERIFETVLLEPVGNVQAATTVVAMNNDVAVFVRLKLTDAIRNFAHRDQRRTFNANEIVLLLFPTIDEQKILASIKAALHGLTVNFHR